MSRFLLRLVIVSVAFLPLASSQTRAADPEDVKITTVDGVHLKGKYWQGKAQGPVVIMLHDYESKSDLKDWVNLAEELNKDVRDEKGKLKRQGFSVLTFDFRGHGNSCDVDPALFWTIPRNVRDIKNYKAGRMTIEVKDFQPAYRPVLINDIAAVKAYLDRKTDGKACNTGATVLIGAGEGATLGSIWLNSDWHRFRLIPDMMMRLVPNKDSEGKDVVACLWLSIKDKAGSHTLSLQKLHFLPAYTGATPVVFMHGEGDETGKKIANTLNTYLKKTEKDKERLKYTGPHAIKGTKLTGPGLLKSEATQDAIVQWLDKVTFEKGNEFAERDFKNSRYVWTVGTGLVPARSDIRETNMYFDTYEKFILR